MQSFAQFIIDQSIITIMLYIPKQFLSLYFSTLNLCLDCFYLMVLN